MLRKIVKTTDAPQAIGPYSQAIDAGGFVFVSGQIPVDPKSGSSLQKKSCSGAIGNGKCQINFIGSWMQHAERC